MTYFIIGYEIIFLGVIFCSIAHHVSPGERPYMIVLYFENDTLTDQSGGRFYRGGILLDAQWVLSSSFRIGQLQHYRYSSLIARAGATNLDAPAKNAVVENEQDRQVVELYEPRRHSPMTWWVSDIALMKLKSPFQLNNFVNIIEYSSVLPTNTICQIVMFERVSPDSERRVLKSEDVFIFDSAKCAQERGLFFIKETMACSYGYDSQKQSISRKGFCYGNAGGPLLCNSSLVGIQSSFPRNGKCAAPHSYQLIAKWDKFVKCSRANNCESRGRDCAGECFKYKYGDGSSEAENARKAEVLNMDEVKELLFTGPDSEISVTTTKTDFHSDQATDKAGKELNKINKYTSRIEAMIYQDIITITKEYVYKSTNPLLSTSLLVKSLGITETLESTTVPTEEILNLIGLEKLNQKDVLSAEFNESGRMSEEKAVQDNNVAESQSVIKNVVLPENIKNNNDTSVRTSSTFKMPESLKITSKNITNGKGRIKWDKDFVEIPEEPAYNFTKRKRHKKKHYRRYTQLSSGPHFSEPIILLYAFLQYYLVVKYF